MRWGLAVAAVSSLGCATLSAERRAALDAEAAPAVAALQAARFDQALAGAKDALTRTRDSGQAAAVYAVALYRQTLHDLATDAVTFGSSVVASSLMRGDFLNRDFLDFAVKRADERLAEVDRALAVAQEDQGVSLELCLACWEVDWNRSGEVDERDRRLLEIERDAQGVELAPQDPRRRPTFRFDWADVLWLRAMVAFQRAALALVQAYQPELQSLDLRALESVRLRLRDAGQVAKARQLFLTGLQAARDCRKALLLETDDDREWVPNPRQKSHAMPLAVDPGLFDTWAGVVDDVEALVRGETGLSVAEVAQLGDRQWEDPPRGFLDVGQLLAAPTDLVVPLEVRAHDRAAVERALSLMFGPALKASMPASGLPRRLTRMRDELDRGEDTLERKLRYLLWLN